MTPTEYITNALRTKSPTTPELEQRLSDHTGSVRYLLGYVMSNGMDMDVFKKKVFYNAEQKKNMPGASYNKRDKGLFDDRLLKCIDPIHAIAGLQTETGELAEVFYNHIFANRPLDTVNMAEEIGDLLWYIAVICDFFNYSFEDIFFANICKLRTRFPASFTESDATNRNLDNERVCLETILTKPETKE